MDRMLEERLEQLEKRVTTLEDQAEIQRLMAAYQAYETAGEGRRLLDELWTQQKPDPTHEYGAGGVYRGLDEISPFYCQERLPGVWQIHPLTTPSITVFDDGCTAGGNWVSLGVELDAGEYVRKYLPEDEKRSKLLSSTGSTGERYRAEWVVQTYHVTFAKEGGAWKIWRMHISEPARCPFGQDWVQFAQLRFETDGLRLDERYRTDQACVPGKKPENIAALPTTWHWQFTWDGEPRLPKEESI